jgi:hypothetical protein
MKTVFALPFFLIHDLKLHKRQKYTVYGIFLLGAITIAIGVARCISLNISPLNTPICMHPTTSFHSEPSPSALQVLTQLARHLGSSRVLRLNDRCLPAES